MLAALACLAVGAVLLISRSTVPDRSPANWALVVCDVGQGDAMLLHTGPDEAVVVDTGPDPAAEDRCLKRFRITTVPLLILTHFHADHIGGLSAVLADTRVREIETTTVDLPPAGAAEVRREAAEAGVPVHRVTPHERRGYGPVSWQVLWPDPAFPLSPDGNAPEDRMPGMGGMSGSGGMGGMGGSGGSGGDKSGGETPGPNNTSIVMAVTIRGSGPPPGSGPSSGPGSESGGGPSGRLGGGPSGRLGSGPDGGLGNGSDGGPDGGLGGGLGSALARSERTFQDWASYPSPKPYPNPAPGQSLYPGQNPSPNPVPGQNPTSNPNPAPGRNPYPNSNPAPGQNPTSNPNPSSNAPGADPGPVLHILLTGDIEQPVQADLLAADRSLLRADVLKVPHHGSANQDPDFVRAVDPTTSIISVGAGNPYGHPVARTVRLMGSTGARLYRTDLDGAVVLSLPPASAAGYFVAAEHGDGHPSGAPISPDSNSDGSEHSGSSRRSSHRHSRSHSYQ